MVVMVFLIGGIISFVFYTNNYERANADAQAALESTSTVEVRQIEGGFGFVPVGVEHPRAGLVFYPDGKVEAAAYAPLMHAFAEQGILCALMEMPFQLAVLDEDAANRAYAAFPEVDTWYVGGHSLGGSISASHASRHTDAVQGVVLLAAYSNEDLSATDLHVISLYGSDDTILKMENYEAAKPNLPAGYKEVIIEGGNHSFFGDYRLQPGDGEGTITREQQQAQTVNEVVSFLNAAA